MSNSFLNLYWYGLPRTLHHVHLNVVNSFLVKIIIVCAKFLQTNIHEKLVRKKDFPIKIYCHEILITGWVKKWSF